MWGAVVPLLLVASAYAVVEPVFPEVYNEVAAPLQSRIVSGWESDPGQFPWQLSLRMVSSIGGVNSCGGSLIHESWGITAAHCTATRQTIVVRTGAVGLTLPVHIFETTEYYNHPQYIDALQSIVQPNDVSILKFPVKIDFSDRVQPIRLQRSVDMDRNYNGDQLIASGWGRTWTEGSAPENMNWVYLRGTSNEDCAQAYGFSSIIVSSTICARYWNVTSQSTCQGDSGGPLVEVEEDGVNTLIGVTSFVSRTGCHTDFPAGFVRPGHYHSWYRIVTGINFDWEPKESSEEAEKSSESAEKSSESSEESSESAEKTTESAVKSSESSET